MSSTIKWILKTNTEKWSKSSQWSHLLVGDEGKDRLIREPRDTEFTEGAAAAANEHLKHTIQLIRLASLAPFLDIDLLPAVRAGNRPPPRFTDPWDYSQDLLKGEVAKYQSKCIRDQLLPTPKLTIFPHTPVNLCTRKPRSITKNSIKELECKARSDYR